MFSFAGIATAVLDGHGTVLRWSQEACDLLGWTAEDACGRPFRALFAEARPGADDEGLPARGRARLRHRAGGPVDVTFRVLDLHPAGPSVVLLAPTRSTDDWGQGASTLRALLAQEHLGMALHDRDLTLVRSNLTPGLLGGATLPPGGRLRDVLSPEDAETGEAVLRRVLRTGSPLTG
ncbi:PAS domain-containing protein, partial [Streptomyces spiralis]